MGFHDHFSDASAGYAAARPTYPEALYEFIASIAPAFPCERIEPPPFHVEVRWTLAQLMDYLSTWTAVKRFVAEGHADFLREAHERLRPAWGGDGPRTVVMPLHLLCGRHAG